MDKQIFNGFTAIIPEGIHFLASLLANGDYLANSHVTDTKLTIPATKKESASSAFSHHVISSLRRQVGQ
ncbi:hypothetical protein DPMN_108637 [Dreissena polymorpha]|uniref:Uncharacterized protein n=1 Tax=Dreissena polymorpha TaxID=45954 RepID=A0A9D4QL78_DREPO|nr:hypothetical protein DPMN_108637 [Dreissena polymorpha]